MNSLMKSAMMLRYHPNYQTKRFWTIMEDGFWVKRFVEWYNTEQSGIGRGWSKVDDKENRL